MTIIEGPEPRPICAEIVYFARLDADGPIKIGATQNWRCRLHELGHSGRRGFPLALVRGGTGLELRFHAAFEPIHLGHEWFSPTEDLMAAIATLNAGTFDWSALPETGWCITKPFQTKASLAHWGPLPRLAA